jgi:hypothetical protein
LRPYVKRQFWKGERRAAKRDVIACVDESSSKGR